MGEQDLKLELSKMQEQSRQWHEDFLQRQVHWEMQEKIWMVTVVLIGLGIIFK